MHMRFSDLCIGDIFRAYGGVFQKLPSMGTPELSEANAFNTVARRPAFFGPTVSVELVERGDFENLAVTLKALITGCSLPS
jgi:hypothetical protein